MLKMMVSFQNLCMLLGLCTGEHITIISDFYNLTHKFLQNALAKTMDAPMTKSDECFEKMKVIIADLTEQWSCEIHSLPNKLSLCWTPKDQPGTCYLITQLNMNFWASRIVSLF
jgi:hypothetical protein